MKVFLIDGTYELFRQFFGRPSHLTDPGGHEVGATRGVLGSTLQLIEDGATHLGVATDHIIESFRNQLYPGYKTGAGIEPALLGQFELLEKALRSMGVVVWAMVDVEADDALASAAVVAAEDPMVQQVVIMTPDKDLAQCVNDRIVQVDRRNNTIYGIDGVIGKFGVSPGSIADYLALVGDSSDGYPGLSGWGAKSTAAVLSVYETIENIPDDVGEWKVKVRGAAALASTLASNRQEAMLYKTLATLRVDRTLVANVEQLRWRGPTDSFKEMAKYLELPELFTKAQRLAAKLDG